MNKESSRPDLRVDEHLFPAVHKMTIKQFVINFSLYVIATVLSIKFARSGIPFYLGNVAFEITFKDIPLILVSGLGGYLWGLLTVFTTFIYLSFKDANYLYIMFVFTITSFIISFYSTHRLLLTRKGAISGAIITAFNLGPLWWFLVNRISDVKLASRPVFETYMIYFWSTLFECLIGFYTLHQFFHFMPDNLKSIFFAGIYYYDRGYQKTQKSTIGNRITFLIAIDCAMLAILAAFTAAFLIPSLPSDVVQIDKSLVGKSEYGIQDIISYADIENKNETGKTSLEYRAGFDIGKMIPMTYTGTFILNRHGIAFYIRMFMLIMNVVIPLGAFTSFFVYRRVALPLTKMTEAAVAFREVLKKGDHEDILQNVEEIHALDIHTGNEIDLLYQRLDNAAQFIVRYLETREKERTMREELSIAQHANTAKNAFLSNMSHELRTPINVILGMDEIILREYADDKNLVLYAGNIKTSGRTLLSLVNDILDFSKIEAGKMSIIPVEYDMGSVINDLYNMISNRAEEKGLKLDFQIEPNLPHILVGDDIRLKQCILNILTNAVKYTQQGSITFILGFEIIDDTSILLHISVADTGMGMKKEEMDRLFTPFERMDEKRNRTIEGTGLGMSIVQKLLGMMGSELKVESTYHKGSVFSFDLKQKVIDWTAIGDYTKSFTESMKSKGQYHISFHAPSASILVVDDTPMNLTVIKGLLKDSLMDIDTVPSGKMCLDMVKSKKYNIIFIDHRMPEMDGIETLHKLKEMGENNISMDAPVIALTANAINGAREEYLSAGFNDYLSKPVDTEKLENMLIQYLPGGMVHLYGTAQYNEDEQADTLLSQSQDGEPNSHDDSRLTANNKDNPLYQVINMSKEEIDEFEYNHGINLSEALKNCGSADLMVDIIRDFISQIDSKAELIKKYCDDMDFENYTTQVHSLKSSARLVGATHLSGFAAHMEQSSILKKEDHIKNMTPMLLGFYVNYKELSSFFENEENNDNLPPISHEELQEYFSGIRELVEAFDFDSADEAIKEMLTNHSIPADYKDKVKKIRTLLVAADRDNLLKML